MSELHEHLYGRVLALYPPTWQREIGDEMRDVFVSSISDGRRSAARAWAIELWELPVNLMAAWSDEPEDSSARSLSRFLQDRIPERVVPYLLVALFLALSIGTTHLFTEAGLFHWATIGTAAAVIVGGGVAIGLVSRLTSNARLLAWLAVTLLLIAVGLATVFAIDRSLVNYASAGTARSIELPGLELSFSASSAVEVPPAADESARRLRIATFGDDVTRTLVVRSYAPDWLWTAAVMVLMILSAAAGRRMRPAGVA